MYRVIKRYGHSEGWSCAFRQHLATHSHCQFIHGYALAFELTFESPNLNEMNWVVDFGGLKDLKEWLKLMFDHKTIIALDDPYLEEFIRLRDIGVIDLHVLPGVGCEKFAEHVYHKVATYLLKLTCGKVTLVSVKVQEHEGNSALFTKESVSACQS